MVSTSGRRGTVRGFRRSDCVAIAGADVAFQVLKNHGRSESTAQFWMSDTPARQFASLRECLLFLADNRRDEALPDVHVHTAEGDIAINGPDLEALIRVASAARAAT